MSKKKQKNVIPNSSSFDLQYVSPLTENQAVFFENYDTNKSQVLLGSSGTGKTFLSLYKAFMEIRDLKIPYNRIVVVRSAVPTRDMGFMPGNLQEKGEVYELPYKVICNQLFQRGDAYELIKRYGELRFMTTSFVRGITLDNTIVIVDEFQSLNGHELESIVTRAGHHTKILFCGDFVQTDLKKMSEKEGSKKFLEVVSNLPDDFCINTFTEQDIVRSGLVKNFIIQRQRQFPDGI